MKKIFKNTLLSLALLAGAFTAQAQVKIGTNPTNIDPNNNLEVQGSNTGRVFSVEKADSKVKIADGTEGAGKVLTSDAAGVASWQPASGAGMINGTLGTAYVPASTANPGYSGTSMTFPKAGTYLVFANWTTNGISTPGGGPVGMGSMWIVATASPALFNYASGWSKEFVWVKAAVDYTCRPFRVTVTAGQTLYFWFDVQEMYGSFKMNYSYALGPY